MATLAWNQLDAKTISVEEYLHTAYSPDCDLVDGIVEERNLGEYEHSLLQTKLTFLLGAQQAMGNIKVLVECRLQVREDRFRVPDLMVLRGSQRVTRIVREAPLLCIEVLSPEDTWARMRSRLNDYLAMGVEHIWCFDPWTREARRYRADGFDVVNEAELTVPGTPIRIALAEAFAALDETEAEPEA